MPRGSKGLLHKIKPELIRSKKITPGPQPLCQAHVWELKQGVKGAEHGTCRQCGATIVLGPVVWAKGAEGAAGAAVAAVEG